MYIIICLITQSLSYKTSLWWAGRLSRAIATMYWTPCPCCTKRAFNDRLTLVSKMLGGMLKELRQFKHDCKRQGKLWIKLLIKSARRMIAPVMSVSDGALWERVCHSLSTHVSLIEVDGRSICFGKWDKKWQKWLEGTAASCTIIADRPHLSIQWIARDQRRVKPYIAISRTDIISTPFCRFNLWIIDSSTVNTVFNDATIYKY